MKVWKKLKQLCRKYEVQLVAASHSPVVLFDSQLQLIEFKKGYAESVRRTLREVVGK